MLNITNHQGNANQNHNKIQNHMCLCRIGWCMCVCVCACVFITENNVCGEDVENLVPLCNLGEHKIVQLLWKQCTDSSKNKS